MKTNENVLVSVIVPTYNRIDELKRALKSISTQEYKNIETIVINDGTIDIDDIIDEYQKHHNIVYIKHDQNKGSGGGA